MLVVVLKNFVLIMMITLIVHYTLEMDTDASHRRQNLHKETFAFREGLGAEPFAPVDSVGMMAKSDPPPPPPSKTTKPSGVADETPAMRELYDFVFDDNVAETQLDAMFAPIEAPKVPKVPKVPKAEGSGSGSGSGGKVMSGCAYEVIGALDAPKEGPAPMGTDPVFSGLI